MAQMPYALMSIEDLEGFSSNKGHEYDGRFGFKEPEGDDAVKVTYGYDKATFYVRKSSVCSGSGFFKTACLAFRETETPKVELDPDIIDPDILRHILRYLNALEPFMGGWHLPGTLDAVLNLYRQARYLQVDELTDHIISGLRCATDKAQIHLRTDCQRWGRPQLFETTWKQVLLDAQVVFAHTTESDNDDCKVIRDIYMEFLHKNHGILMELGKPFATFMRQTPDLAFIMLQDAYKNKDRNILAPLGFSTKCVHCKTEIGGRDPFFMLVHSRNDDVDHICRKVACRRMAKRNKM